jgi:hypothetical protein
VTLLQRFGSALNFNFHFHIFLDGMYFNAWGDFLPLKAPNIYGDGKTDPPDQLSRRSSSIASLAAGMELGSSATCH